MNLCRCGCGNFCKKLFKRGHNHKNKSYESIYGKERANEIKKVISLKTKIFQSQPYEIKWGKEVAEKVKQERAEKIRQRCLGKTKIELYGEEHAKKIIDTQKKKISKSYEEHFGLEKALEIKQKQSLSKKVWTKEKIIDAFKNINKTFGKIQRCEIKNYAKKGLICYEQAIVNEVGSLDMLVNLSGYSFNKINKGRVGKNEIAILDFIEREYNSLIQRNKMVVVEDKKHFFVDGIDFKNKIIYEVDEEYHNKYKIEDEIRQNKIQRIFPDFQFKRINEKDGLKLLNTQVNQNANV